MRTLNRSALTLRPKQPFLDWLHALPEESNRELTLEDLRRENTVYLLDEVDTLEQAIEQITPLIKDIFSEQLAGWSTAKDKWPDGLTIGQLLEWFEVELGTMVADVGTEGLRVEEL
ncbi:hypothetical protein ACFL6C_12350 [Myxococcota bacterium]